MDDKNTRIQIFDQSGCYIIDTTVCDLVHAAMLNGRLRIDYKEVTFVRVSALDSAIVFDVEIPETPKYDR